MKKLQNKNNILIPTIFSNQNILEANKSMQYVSQKIQRLKEKHAMKTKIALQDNILPPASEYVTKSQISRLGFLKQNKGSPNSS